MSATLLECAARIVRGGRPAILLRYGRSPGDSLLCSAILHELRARRVGPLWMQTDHPSLFERSPDVDLVVPYRRTVRRLVRLAGGRVVYPDYAPYDPATDRSRPPDAHILVCMARAVGVSGPIALRPWIFLGEEERAGGLLAEGQIAVQSTGLGARMPMRNKEWGVERMQEVVSRLRRDHPVVQLGAPGDPLLDGVIDARGVPFRRSAAILSRSACFVGLVGFLMHLARAVDCRSVIVFGGREAPWQSGYPENANLYTEVSCAPCWLWNRCDYERKCLTAIEPGQVVERVGTFLDSR